MRKILLIAALAAGAAHAGGVGAFLDGYNQARDPQSRPTPQPDFSAQPVQQPVGAAAVLVGMQQVQTVTGLYAWRCEYEVNGQRFYKVFTASCPGYIQVQ
jgi:hypothetical protein